ncbi:dynein regulatory complex protein 10 isoform X2 [Rhea pennata]|uniref:dynein regulatory complex protein 10 isoform X2 n=1 Tax=Rhea pennata TaxID=8795 RepID=UPI002E2610B5
METRNPTVLQGSSQDVKQRNKPLIKGIQTPKKEVIRLDAVRMLDRSQSKPDTHETQRIISVLDETIVKLELSSLIPCIIDSLDRFADMLGPEITNDLIKHQKLSSEMEHLLSSFQEEDTTRAEEQRGCLCLLEQHLKSSVRNVLRLLLANPSLCQALKYEVCARQSSAEVFIKAFREFRNLMHERLLTSPLEEKEKIRFTEDISHRIKKNTETLTALRAELAATIQSRDEKKKCKVEMEIEKWIQKYDADMGEKQAEYEELYALYSEEKAQVSLLQEKHAVLIEEYSQIEEERRIRQKKKEQDLEELTTMTLAATRIQAFWRGYLVRSLFKSKRKKKKKGRGRNLNK